MRAVYLTNSVLPDCIGLHAGTVVIISPVQSSH